MEFIVQAMKQHTRVDNVDYYVDNAVYHYPPSEGQDNTRLANEEFKRIIEFLRVANVPYHEVVEPTTNFKFLGWMVDTEKLSVTVTQERREWIKQTANAKSVSVKLINQVIGVLEFLSTAVLY